MSDIESANVSETAASNNAASPNGAPEGMAPSGVNDTIREVMAAAKRDWNRSHTTIVSTGSTNAYAIAYTTAPAAYVNGQQFAFNANFANSASATANVNALGAKTIQKQTSAGMANLAAGDIQSGQHVILEYDSSLDKLVLLNPQAASVANTVPNGLTGQTTFTAHGVVLGEGTSGLGITATGSAGQALVSNGSSADPSYQYVGFRNWCLNGCFGVWQRGAGGSASIAVAASSVAYTADRWYLATLANQACTVAQTAITTLAGTRYAARVQRNSGQTGTGVLVFAQPLDSDVIAAIVGQTCVLSAQVSTGANWSPTSGTLSYKVYCGTGSPGKRNATPYSGETAPISGSANIAAGMAVGPITIATGAIPAGATQMEIQFFWTPVGTAGANDWFQISNIQLEVGSVATPFDAARQNFIDELARCQRFFEKTFPYGTAPAQSAGNAGAIGIYTIGGSASTNPQALWLFKAVKRVTPSITFFNPGAANALWRDTTAPGDAGAGVVSNSSDASALLTSGTNIALGQHIAIIHATATRRFDDGPL